MRVLFIAAVLLVSATSASAAPLFRMTLQGSFGWPFGPSQCQLPVCDFTNLRVEVIIDDFAVNRYLTGDGTFVTRTTWHASDWSIVSPSGVSSPFPQFQPGATLTGSGLSRVSSPYYPCCADFELQYNDGVSSVLFVGLGDVAGLDPWYQAVGFPLNTLFYMTTPAAGSLSYYGHLSPTGIEPIPEPSTFMLVATGVGGLLMRRRILKGRDLKSSQPPTP